MKAVTEEFVHFHLPPIKNNQSTLFGLSCYRQIATSQLSQITPDMTRSSVQKSIVVLASKPVLFQIKNKLAMVTQSYFEQKDFSLVEILDVFYESLKVQLNTVLEMEDDDDNNLSAKSFGNLMDVYCSGIDLHPFIDTFKTGVLKLLKAVMIGKKVMFYGHHVEKITSFQYALISLIPDALLHLSSTSSTSLDSESSLFGLNSVWLPYIPLQQIEVLFESTSYLVGTSNALFKLHKQCTPDVIANCKDGSIEIVSSVNAMLALSAVDRKWMQGIVDLNAQERMDFIGSDEDLRMKFMRYVHGISDGSEYNQSWVNAYKSKWEIQGLGHPCASTQTSLFKWTRMRSKSKSSTNETDIKEVMPVHEDDKEDDRIEAEYIVLSNED